MLSLLLPLLIAQAAPAAACDTPVALPAALAGWRSPTRVPGIGKAFTVTARDPKAIRGLAATGVDRPGRAALVPIEIATTGTYRVALSEPVWVDVVRDGAVQPAVAHGRGPTCSGIRKIVDFRLVPGRYALQLSAVQTARVRVLIAHG
ncbi:hypothetical protein ACFO8O_01395 [Hephaestia sp. GCM10023244]|uniref:hypothetical protein n=1 Tax=unclassified Hephaestia TaxID=2631281 RepID=UPI00207768F9|nr:hypothetical protein [Hephaestia sp. MAHUQ-44]MCM8729625.1 hypothetical protein [Hephaestia sp. MAHUQ-44]